METWVNFSGRMAAFADHSRGITNMCRIGSESTIHYEHIGASTNLAGVRYWRINYPIDETFVEVYNQRMRELNVGASKP
jgi:hypothetical protein